MKSSGSVLSRFPSTTLRSARRISHFFVNLWIHEPHTPHYPEPEALENYAHLDEQLQTYAAIADVAERRIGKVLRALDELALTENTLVVCSSDTARKSRAWALGTALDRPSACEGAGATHSRAASGRRS